MGLEGAYALRDDAAALAPPTGSEFVVTMDTLIDGLHFLFDGTPHSAAMAARKALAVNVSDLAAKGATPFAYLMSLALPEGYEAWLDGFVEGLESAQSEWGLKLAGGDTVRSNGALAVTITALGSVPAGGMVQRSTASAGDVLMVSGTVGDAYAGLMLARGEKSAADWRERIGEAGIAHLLARMRTPTPRVPLIAALRRYATAALDISDGLPLDASRLAAASGLAAKIETAKLPLSTPVAALLAEQRLTIAALASGGDDYEVLAAVGADDVAAFTQAAAEAGLPVARIGWLEEGAGLVLLSQTGTPIELDRLGWDHLA